MKTQLDFVEVLQRVEFPGFSFVLGRDGDTPFLQVACDGKCNVTGEDMPWRGRKWRLSPHMTDGEVVQTAFKAVLTALEHEAREQFTYRGTAVFDPHYDIEKLVALRRQSDALAEREVA